MDINNGFTIKEVRDFWDSVAKIYEGENNKISDTHYQRFTEAIKYLDLKNGDRVLNIWSRTGSAIPFLRNKNQNIELYNLEVSSQMITEAKEKFPEEKFEQTDLSEIKFPDNYFDYVLSLETLEHCPSPRVFLRELNRLLKPGGKLILSTPPATCEPFYAIYNYFGLGHGEGPHKFLSSRLVRQLLAESNFKLCEHKGTLLVPIGPRFIKALGETIIRKFQHTFISELGIRQFYVCTK